MQFQTFVAWRQRDLGTSPLVAYRLRKLFAHRWVRFHSLPRSKRYADSDAELDEIHRRHDAVAAALLGEGEPIVIVRTGYSAFASPVRPDDGDGQWSTQGFVWLESLTLVEIDNEPSDFPSSYAHFWLGHSTFRTGAFHTAWTLLANDVIDNALFVNVERRCIFAPYDGGMDVIAADTFVCDALRRDFSDWLSAHPGGL